MCSECLHPLRSPFSRPAALLVLSLAVSSISAQTVSWTGAGSDNAWDNPANWDNGVPDANTASVFLGAGNDVSIPQGVQAVFGASSGDGSLFGPEWGGTLDIHGSLEYRWYMHPVGAADNRATINLHGSISGEGIGLGQNWFFNDGPYVTMNLFESSSVNINYMFWGGELNLHGGTFSTGGMNLDNPGLVSDATRRMDITEGTLILRDADGVDWATAVSDWINRGILVAYDGAGWIEIDTTSVVGQTIVTAAIPEPSAVALPVLGAVALASLLRRRR
ncbi:MAG: hypothetical protein ACLFR7_00990 [Opitutales bacterium]